MHTGKIGERRGERASEERQVGLKVKVAGKKEKKRNKKIVIIDVKKAQCFTCKLLYLFLMCPQI